MKTRLVLLLALVLCPLALRAEEEAAKPDFLPWQQDFSNLPADRRAEFNKHMDRARELFGQKRVFEVIDELHQAEAIFDHSPDVFNMLGACQVEFRSFDRAMEYFKKADEVQANNPNVIFNIAEVHFVTKQWADAAAGLERVLSLLADKGEEANLQMSRLVEFKLLLCQMKLGNLDKAKEIAARHDFLDDSPFPYYASASLAYQAGDVITAESEVARARRIFRNPALLSPWQDTLMEFGYIKSFIGGDLDDAAAEGSGE